MRHGTSSRRRLAIGVVSSLGLLASGFSGDVVASNGSAAPNGSDTTTPSEDSTAADGPNAGCGSEAVTDISDLSADRPVARCEAGYPQAIPLAEPDTFTIAIRPHVVWAPILLAEELGEFEAENVDVEFIELEYNDALAEVGRGGIDAAAGGAQAVWYNAVEGGFDISWTIANFFPSAAGDPSVPQTGLWARRDAFADPESPDIAELAGTTFGTAVVGGNTTMYFLANAFEGTGADIGDLEVQAVPPADMVQALESNAVQSAWVIDPFWQTLAEQPEEYVLLATQTAGEPIGGLFTGPSCEGERRETCVAVYRAIIRSLNTYLQGEVGADSEAAAALASATGQDAETIAATLPSMVFDWEIREGTTTRVQDVFIEFGELIDEPVVQVDEPLPEEQLVDRSLFLEAIGQAE